MVERNEFHQVLFFASRYFKPVKRCDDLQPLAENKRSQVMNMDQAVFAFTHPTKQADVEHKHPLSRRELRVRNRRSQVIGWSFERVSNDRTVDVDTC